MGSPAEPRRVGVERRGEGRSAGVVDGVSGAEVDGGGGMPADPGMPVDVVVLVEEFGAELFGVLQRLEVVGEIGQVFQGPVLRFRERVVIGHVWSGMGAGDTQVGEQHRHRFGGHRSDRKTSVCFRRRTDVLARPCPARAVVPK